MRNFIRHLPFGFSEEIPDKVSKSVSKQVNDITDPQVDLIYYFVGWEVYICITSKFKNGENKY